MSFFTSNSFIFNGLNSLDFGLIPVWFDGDIDTDVNGLKRDIIKSEILHEKIKHNVYGVENSEPITFSFGIAKPNGNEINREESIRINQWLSSPLPQLLKFNDEESYSLHYYAICTSITDKVIGGKLVGKEITFTTNSSYAFEDKISKAFNIQDELIFYFNNLCDTNNGLYYPTITIATIGESIVIENMTDNNSLTLNLINIPSDENGNKIIRMDCAHMTITDKDNNLFYANDVGWNNTYKSYISTINKYTNNIYWFRLLQGANQIKVTGTCIFTIECEFPRKAGCC